MRLCRSSSNVPCLPSFVEMLQNNHVLLTFDNIHNLELLPRETTSEPPKVVRTPSVFNFFDFKMCFVPQRRALFRDLNFQKWSESLVFLTFWFPNVLRATTACTFSRSELPKVVPTPSVFNILTSKCASRHNGVHFFNIWTSKSGPTLRCFVHFDFEMCFAPQRRALFRHLNFQKSSEAEVFCTFWLANVLRATTVCNFSSLIWPAGSAPAALASLLFDPPEPQIIGKTQRFATFLLFHASASSFFLPFFLLIFLFSLPLPCSAFHLSILSEVWLLNFLRQLQLQLHCTALHDTTRHYTNYAIPQLQLHYTMHTTLHHTTVQLQLQLQLQLQPRYTPLHPAVMGEVTIATIPTTPKNTTPTTFRSISGFTLPSMHHNNSPLLYCPILETSAAALCGTTGSRLVTMEYHEISR